MICNMAMAMKVGEMDRRDTLEHFIKAIKVVKADSHGKMAVSTKETLSMDNSKASV